MACGGSGHSHRACVLLGAALHRRFLKLDSHKGMKDVVDVILRLLLWDWRETGVDEEIYCLSYAPSCDVIAAGSESGKIVFINAQTGEKILCSLKVDGQVESLDFSPCGTKIAATSNNYEDETWEIKTFNLNLQTGDGKIESELTLSCGSKVLCLALKDNIIAAGCANGEIKMFKLNESQDFREIHSQSTMSCGSAVLSLDFKDNMIIAGCSNGEIKIFKLDKFQDWGEILSEPPLSCGDLVWDVRFSPDGKHIAAGCSDGRVFIFSLNQQYQDWEIRSDLPLSCDSPVLSLDFTDNMIAAGCGNGEIKIVKLNESQDLWKIQSESSLTGHSSAVTGVAFSADGQWLVSGSCDTTIRLWDARPGGGTVVSAV